MDSDDKALAIMIVTLILSILIFSIFYMSNSTAKYKAMLDKGYRPNITDTGAIVWKNDRKVKSNEQ
jgi:hypothetical protein